MNDSLFSLIHSVFSLWRRLESKELGVCCTQCTSEGINEYGRFRLRCVMRLRWERKTCCEVFQIPYERLFSQCQRDVSGCWRRLKTNERRHWCHVFSWNITVIVWEALRHGWIMTLLTCLMVFLSWADKTRWSQRKFATSEIINTKRPWLVAHH